MKCHTASNIIVPAVRIGNELPVLQNLNCSAIVIAYVRLRNGESRPRHALSAKVVDLVALLKPSQTTMFVDEEGAQT